MCVCVGRGGRGLLNRAWTLIRINIVSLSGFADLMQTDLTRLPISGFNP